MAKRPQTAAKRARELELKERRERKRAKKEERRSDVPAVTEDGAAVEETEELGDGGPPG